MNHSAAFCLGQAAHHRDRAATSGLANVRNIAEKAAAAWDSEANMAGARERRRSAAKLVVALAGTGHDSELPQDCRVPDPDELPDDAALVAGMSENPDREFAST